MGLKLTVKTFRIDLLHQLISFQGRLFNARPPVQGVRSKVAVRSFIDIPYGATVVDQAIKPIIEVDRACHKRFDTPWASDINLDCCSLAAKGSDLSGDSIDGRV